MIESFLFILFVILLFTIPIGQSLSNAIRRSQKVYGNIESISPNAASAIAAIEAAVTFSGGNSSDLQPLVQRVRRLLEQSAAILEGVRLDTHACIKPGVLSSDLVSAEVILPDVGAFAHGKIFGDAQITEDKTVIRNEPLRTLQHILFTIRKLLSDVAIKLSVPVVSNDGTRVDIENRLNLVTSQSIIIEQEMIQAQIALVVACEEQRTRFKATRPELSRYSFKSNSIHNRITIPNYEFGSDKVMALRRDTDTPGPFPSRDGGTSYTNDMMTVNDMERNQPGRNAMRNVISNSMFTDGD